MVKTYTIESNDHRAHMSEHKDGRWVSKSDYDAVAELTAVRADKQGVISQRAAMEKHIYGLADRITALEAELAGINNVLAIEESNHRVCAEMNNGLRDHIATIESALHALLDSGDHMMGCDLSMSDMRPCTCGADRYRELIGVARPTDQEREPQS